jgi:hypothetical protein
MAQPKTGTSFEERVKNPNMELRFPLQQTQFSAPSAPGLGTAVSVRPGMDVSKSASVAGFRETRSFLGIRNPWLGGKVVEAQPVRGTAFVVPGLARGFTQSPAAVRPFYEGRKDAGVNPAPVVVRPFAGNGSAQGALDLATQATKREISIDELRELLNKPR